MTMDKEKKQPVDSVRNFVDAADIKDIYIYRKDGYIICFLKIAFFNFDLLSKSEKRAMAKNLTANLQNDRQDFIYCTYPRELNLDDYREELKSKHMNTDNIGKRHILEKMMKECIDLTSNGEYFEHQHFIKIWKYGKNKKEAEAVLRERIVDFQTSYRNVGISCEIVQERELVKICNMYGNALQISDDVNLMYTPITEILEETEG